MRMDVLVVALLAAHLAFAPVQALAADGSTCGGLGNQGTSNFGFFNSGTINTLDEESPRLRFQLAVTIGRAGLARTHGVARISDGSSNTVLIAEAGPTTASCADTNDNGVAGLTSLQFVMRDVHSGELVPVSIIPASGEIDKSGEDEVIIVIGDTTFVERVKTHVSGFLTRAPE